MIAGSNGFRPLDAVGVVSDVSGVRLGKRGPCHPRGRLAVAAYGVFLPVMINLRNVSEFRNPEERILMNSLTLD
jgi:hypothetical protein